MAFISFKKILQNFLHFFVLRQHMYLKQCVRALWMLKRCDYLANLYAKLSDTASRPVHTVSNKEFTKEKSFSKNRNCVVETNCPNQNMKYIFMTYEELARDIQ